MYNILSKCDANRMDGQGEREKLDASDVLTHIASCSSTLLRWYYVTTRNQRRPVTLSQSLTRIGSKVDKVREKFRQTRALFHSQ